MRAIPDPQIRDRRRGATALDVIVVTIILGLFVLLALLILPRRREVARLTGCQRNLMQIGVGLALYDRAEGAIPTVPPLGTDRDGASPLRAILQSLVIPDLNGLAQDSPPPKPIPGSVPGERSVPGFVCPSDPLATGGLHPAPISYRATTGDQPDGVNGGFAPGRLLKLSDLDREGADGRSFTAAFSERLVGTGKDGDPSPRNYAVVPGPLEKDGCPSSSTTLLRGDAGASWISANWRSTLYNHALTPNAARSCLAGDGRSAFLGASSGHEPGVSVLMFDGSARTVTPTIAPEIWRSMATTESAPPSERRDP